jgi:hypothetical protein
VRGQERLECFALAAAGPPTEQLDFATDVQPVVSLRGSLEFGVEIATCNACTEEGSSDEESLHEIPFETVRRLGWIRAK